MVATHFAPKHAAVDWLTLHMSDYDVFHYAAARMSETCCAPAAQRGRGVAALPRHRDPGLSRGGGDHRVGSRLQREEIGQVALTRGVRALSDLDAVAAIERAG